MRDVEIEHVFALAVESATTTMGADIEIIAARIVASYRATAHIPLRDLQQVRPGRLVLATLED